MLKIILLALFFLTELLIAQPSPVTDLTVVSTNWRKIKLQWTVPQSVEPIVRYEIRCSTYKILSTELDWITNSSENTYPYRVTIDTSTLQGTVTSYIFTNLTNGKTYFFAIKSSTDSSGTVFSNIDNNSARPFGTPMNTSPPIFNLDTPTNGSLIISQNITFDWQDVNDIDILHGDTLKYEVYYSTYSTLLYSSTPPDITGATVVANLTTSYLSLPISNFLDNTTYYWRVKCIDEEMAFSWSIQDESQGRFIVNRTSEPPTIPNFILPLNGSTITFTGSGVFFDWDDVSDPDPQDYVTYSLFISSISSIEGFANFALGLTWSSITINSVFGGWVENATYWYYLRAIDTTNLYSQTTTRYFILNNTNDGPIPNFLVSVGTNVYSEPIIIVYTLNPIFRWEQTFDPDPYSKVFYQLFISSFSNEPDDLNSVYYTTTDKLKYATYYHLTDFTLEEETTYFWRIKIWDEIYGGFTYSTTTFWFFTNAINDPPVAATLVSPLLDSTTIFFYPKFEWVLGYDQGYDGSVSSQTLLYWTKNTTTTITLTSGTSYYIPTQPLENFSTYYWKIITYDNGVPLPVLSSESITGKFFINNSSPTIFQLLAPVYGEIVSTSTPTLVWQESLDPEGYEIYYRIDYSTYSDFNFYITTSGLKVTTFTFTESLKDNTTYYFKLFAFDEQGVWSKAGDVNYFIVDYIPQLPAQFNLLQPENNKLISKKVPTTFYWEQTFDPDPFDNVRYQIIISTETNFGSTYFSSNNITTNTIVLTEDILNLNTTYFWYVIAISSRSGFRVSNSTYTLYTTNLPPTKPVLFSPYNYEIIKSSYITLKWQSSIDFENDNFVYKIHITTTIYTYPPWPQEVIYEVPQTQTEFSFDLQNNTTYNWYVVAIDTYGHSSLYNNQIFWVNFKNSSPTVPSIISPLDETKISLPYTFLWSTSTDVDIFDNVNYMIKISTNSDLSNEIILSSISVPTYLLNNYFLLSGTYYWQIVAYDKNSATSKSSINKFFIPDYNIILNTPPNLTKLITLPEFSWSLVEPVVLTDTITYILTYSTDSSFNFKNQVTTTSTSYKIPTFLKSNSTYYWYVESQDSYSRKNFSMVYKFYTPTTKPLDPAEITISTTSLGVLLLWQKVEKNVDGTDFLDFSKYKLYRTLDLNSSATLFAETTNTFYIDKEGLVSEYFYIIKTLNQWGEESFGNNIIRFYKNGVAKIFTSEDKSIVVITSSEDIRDNVITITRKNLLETPQEPLICEITVGEKNKLDVFIDVSIKIPDTNKKYKVQYYDGFNWQTIPSKIVATTLNFKTQYLGKYRLILDDTEIETLTILGCSPYKRIITPNNDGYNDEINFVYLVGTYLVGEIYDTSGKKIANMKQKDTNILYFDGKNDNGDYVLPGVYIYHITAKTGTTNLKEKTFTGTIVIKY